MVSGCFFLAGFPEWWCLSNGGGIFLVFTYSLIGKDVAFPMRHCAYVPKASMLHGSFLIWVARKSYGQCFVQAYKSQLMTKERTIHRLAVKYKSSVVAANHASMRSLVASFLPALSVDFNIPALTSEAGKPCPRWVAPHGLLVVGLAVVAGAAHRQASQS